MRELTRTYYLETGNIEEVIKALNEVLASQDGTSVKDIRTYPLTKNHFPLILAVSYRKPA